ncbi:MAG: hypothetical protein Q9219_006237 [cf. Caloplaca sp. 3 TL-2023]
MSGRASGSQSPAHTGARSQSQQTQQGTGSQGRPSASTAGQGGLSPHWTPIFAQPGPSHSQPGPARQMPTQLGYSRLMQGQRPARPQYPAVRLANITNVEAHRNHVDRLRELRRDIQRAWDDTTDGQLAEFLDTRYHGQAPNQRPTIEHAFASLEAFFQLTFWNMDARGAVFWVIRSNWNLETAMEAYMDSRFQTVGVPGSERDPQARPDAVSTPAGTSVMPRRQAAGTGSSDEVEPEPYVDEDPQNIGSIPAGLDVHEYKHSNGSTERCVRHEKIRQYLINQAARQGQYQYPRASGPEASDKTAYLRAQRDWGFEDRSQYPPIIFVFLRKDRKDPAYNPPSMRWRGLLVVDSAEKPIRRFRNIPAALSSHTEGGLMEAIMREDSRIGIDDLRSLMPREWPREKVDGTVTITPVVPGTLNQRVNRFRSIATCINWRGNVNAVKPFDRSLQDNLPAVLRDANNTRGLARDLTEREIGRMNQSHLLAQKLVMNMDLIDEYPLGVGGRARSAYHPDKEHDCRDCLPRAATGNPDTDWKDQEALNDAILITVMHFFERTGGWPRVPLDGTTTYNGLYSAIVSQSRAVTRAARNEPQPLRKIGRWTGGIQRWRSGRVS